MKRSIYTILKYKNTLYLNDFECNFIFLNYHCFQVCAFNMSAKWLQLVKRHILDLGILFHDLSDRMFYCFIARDWWKKVSYRHVQINTNMEMNWMLTLMGVFYCMMTFVRQTFILYNMLWWIKAYKWVHLISKSLLFYSKNSWNNSIKPFKQTGSKFFLNYF